MLKKTIILMECKNMKLEGDGKLVIKKLNNYQILNEMFNLI